MRKSRWTNVFLAVVLLAVFAFPAVGVESLFPYKNSKGQVGKSDRIWNEGHFNYLYFHGSAPLILEGATEDAYETTIGVTDPIADATVTVPNYTGTLPVVIYKDSAGGTATNATADGTYWTIPANLFRAGSVMRLTAAGSITNGAGTPAIALKLDSADSAVMTLSKASAVGGWKVVFDVYQVGLSSQRVVGTWQVNGLAPIVTYATSTTDFSSAKTAKIQLVSNHASDAITQSFGLVEFLP